jgi:hypothetical protein
LAGTPALIWKDNEIFNSSIKGVALAGSRLTLAVGHQRRIGFEDRRNLAEDGIDGSKRWGDDAATRRDLSVVVLSPDGKQVSRRYQSAGLSLFVQGIAMSNGRLIVYGALGGMPALSDAGEPPIRNSAAVKSKIQSRQQPDWKADVLRSH